MKKWLLLCLCTISLLFAKLDFSEMSTEELVALIGYIDKTEETAFYQEIERRFESMNETQKALYEAEKQRRDHE